MRSSIFIGKSKASIKEQRMRLFFYFLSTFHSITWRVIVVGRGKRHRNGIMTQLMGPMGRFVPEGCSRGVRYLRDHIPYPTLPPPFLLLLPGFLGVRHMSTADTREPRNSGTLNLSRRIADPPALIATPGFLSLDDVLQLAQSLRRP
jgi:hypothetical protein